MQPLHLLYQDEWLVAIDKPAGMIVHPGPEPEDDEHIAMKRLRDHSTPKVQAKSSKPSNNATFKKPTMPSSAAFPQNAGTARSHYKPPRMVTT
jgi:hypothetical protein